MNIHFNAMDDCPSPRCKTAHYRRDILGKITAALLNTFFLEKNVTSATKSFLRSLLILLLFSGVFSCAGKDATGGAGGAIEGYLEALVNKDSERLVNFSCSAWEPQAHLELDSFGAVDSTLENASCTESGKDGDTTLVSCSGEIKANYGAEVLTINLADRVYRAVYEDGEWRMCGYH